MKKCWELANMCDLKIYFAIYDKNRNYLQQYTTKADFTIERVTEIIAELKDMIIDTKDEDMFARKSKRIQDYMFEIPICVEPVNATHSLDKVVKMNLDKQLAGQPITS